MRIAAIDQGTTSTRVLVTDSSGAADILHALRHRQSHPQPGWVEHAPLELLAHVHACVEAAGHVDAIGIDNQGESCLAWDATTGEPLSPVIVWQDNRTADHLTSLAKDGADTVAMARAALPLDPYFSASKLAWLVRHNSEVAKALHAGRLRLGTTDAFFLDRLTGKFVTDISTASRTSLMNLQTGQWDEELCRLFAVPMHCLPTICQTVGDFGVIRGIPVTASIVDQQAALYGHGCRDPGDAKITFGTGAFALTVTGSEIVRVPERGLLPTVAWQISGETTYALDGGVYDAGSAIEWAQRLGLYKELAEISAFDQPAAISRGLAFVPALSGLACPHWDRNAGALWMGMRASTSNRDLCQAMLEGIAFCAAEVIFAMAGRVSGVEQLSIDGGLARNVYFSQFLADLLGRTVLTHRFDELTAFGCASLAALGLGSALPKYQNETMAFSPKQPPETVKKWISRFQTAVKHSLGWHA